MAARCPKRANEAIAWLKAATKGKSPIFLQLDLADLQSVRAAAAEFMRYVQRVLAPVLVSHKSVQTRVGAALLIQ
jgi:hypothetical protein